MQLLTFTIESEIYAIESRLVVEVVPLVPSRPVPRAPQYIRGVFTYRGRLVPLIDLGRRLADAPLRERLSTRVIVADCGPSHERQGCAGMRLGLVAENVFAIRSTTDADASLPPLQVEGAPYLGRLLRIDGRTIQLLAVDRVLPPELASSLMGSTSAMTDESKPPIAGDAPLQPPTSA